METNQSRQAGFRYQPRLWATLTHLLVLGLAYALFAGRKPGFFRSETLAWIGLALVLANVVYELFIPLLNTRDPMDAVYGVAGTLLAFAWLMVVRRIGRKELPVAED